MEISRLKCVTRVEIIILTAYRICHINFTSTSLHKRKDIEKNFSCLIVLLAYACNSFQYHVILAFNTRCNGIIFFNHYSSDDHQNS